MHVLNFILYHDIVITVAVHYTLKTFDSKILIIYFNEVVEYR